MVFHEPATRIRRCCGTRVEVEAPVLKSRLEDVRVWRPRRSAELEVIIRVVPHRPSVGVVTTAFGRLAMLPLQQPGGSEGFHGPRPQ
jgi:hypothetical protein